MAGKNSSRHLRIVRVYDAPVSLVWDAWTDPAQVAQWWGPRGFTLTTHSKDLRPGGTWRYTMHGPDGIDYPNVTLYHEVEKHTRLVYDHGATDDRPPLFRVTVVFSELEGDKTRMDMTMTLPTPEAAEQIRKFIKKAGGDATWDRLAEYVGKQTTGKDRFVINRSFDAPLDVMHEMWTNPKHVSQWAHPIGMRMEYLRADIRPGGTTFYFMSGNGVTMYGRAEYREIEKHRLVYTQQFCDENEKVSRHPMVPVWPATILTTVVLSEEGPDRTRVTVTWEPLGEITREELEAFLKMKASMTQGWTGSFDKLEALLAAL